MATATPVRPRTQKEHDKVNTPPQWKVVAYHKTVYGKLNFPAFVSEEEAKVYGETHKEKWHKIYFEVTQHPDKYPFTAPTDWGNKVK
jgi:hypothetical protein